MANYFATWTNMLARCYDPKVKSYKNYGARGIIVCEEWRTDFRTFIKWCEDQNAKPGDSLDRIDCNGNYTPENCRYVNRQIQMENRRCTVWVDYKGQKRMLIDVARELKLDYGTIRARKKNYPNNPEVWFITDKSEALSAMKKLMPPESLKRPNNGGVVKLLK